jgi:hypothetical protein
MRGMRNIVAHDYANVALKIVWWSRHRVCAGNLLPWKSFLTVRIERPPLSRD